MLDTPAVRQIAHTIRRRGESLDAPHLIDLEVLQAVRRFVGTGQLGPGRAAEALHDLTGLGIERSGDRVLATRIREPRENATAHGVACLALAEGLATTLLTCGTALASVPEVQARREVV